MHFLSLRTEHENQRRELSLKILGIVTETHDSGIALLDDGVPALILEEERINREKHTQEFPRYVGYASTNSRPMPSSAVPSPIVQATSKCRGNYY